MASENLQVLKDNGFEVQESDAASMGGRLRLMAQPVSKNTVFDIKGSFRSVTTICSAAHSHSRFGGAYTFTPRLSFRNDGPVFQGSSHVCVPGVSKECHGWHATEPNADGYSKINPFTVG